jgi:hypothetical protein
MSAKVTKKAALTPLERANLRLTAWNTLNGWGQTIPATKPDGFPEHKGWDFETRMTRASALFEWLIK